MNLSYKSLGIKKKTTPSIKAMSPNDVSEILQLLEMKDLLMVPSLCHFHGMMEYWNDEILEIKAEVRHCHSKKIPSNPLFHYSTIPTGP